MKEVISIFTHGSKTITIQFGVMPYKTQNDFTTQQLTSGCVNAETTCSTNYSTALMLKTSKYMKDYTRQKC